MNTDYPIGTRFETQRVVNQKTVRYIETISDIHRTYNAAGELIRERYVATHDFLGQAVERIDIKQVEVARGIARLQGLPA